MGAPDVSVIRDFLKDMLAENGDNWIWKFKQDCWIRLRILSNFLEATMVKSEFVNRSVLKSIGDMLMLPR